MMSTVTVFRKTITNANILSVEIGTNCPKGGDTGHGGRTVFRLFDEAGTDLKCGVNGEIARPVISIEIILSGDTEAKTFAEALEFAAGLMRRARLPYESLRDEIV